MLLSFTGLLCTFLVFMSLVGHHDDELDDLRHWAQQPWEPVGCSVKEAGITYTGDCTSKESATFKFIKPLPSYNFTKCADRMAESCDSAVDDGGDEEALCSYGAGLLKESISEHWEHTLAGRGELDSGASHTCWRLTLESIGLLKVHDCHVVALTDPKSWEQASEAYVRQQHGLQSVLLGIGGCAAVLGLVAALVHHWLRKSGIERWDDLLSVDALSRLPCMDMASASDSARARLTRERWGQFRANVLAEYRSGMPPSSRDYERVPATDPTASGESAT